MKKVLVFGTFDGIHKGHLNFLKQARKYGDSLVVVVARDATVKKIKGKHPRKNESQRLKDIKNQKLVSDGRLGHLDNPHKIIEEVRPDIICLGYDQSSFTENLGKEIKNRGLNIKIARLKAYQPEEYHSSKLNNHA